MTKDDLKALQRITNSNDVIADVLKLTAVMESRLEDLLGIYFAGPERHFEFVALIASNLSLDRKLKILKNMKFHKPMKSVTNIISSLERLKGIRNKLAHSWNLDEQEIKKISSDKELVRFLLEYPKSFSKEKHILENSFSMLWRSWEARAAKQSAT